MSASFRPTSWFPFWADFMWPPGSHSSSMGTPEFRSFHWPQLCSTNGCLAATFTVQSVFKENSVPRSYWKAKNENVSLWNMFQIQVSYLSADVLVTFLIAATKYLKKVTWKGVYFSSAQGKLRLQECESLVIQQSGSRRWMLAFSLLFSPEPHTQDRSSHLH